MTHKEMEENSEVRLDNMSPKQLAALVQLGEIDPYTYYEQLEYIRHNSWSYKMVRKIKSLFGKGDTTDE